jgi:hypothetical protein
MLCCRRSGGAICRWYLTWHEVAALAEGGGDRGWWQRVVVTWPRSLSSSTSCKKKENTCKLIEQIRKKENIPEPKRRDCVVWAHFVFKISGDVAHLPRRRHQPPTTSWTRSSCVVAVVVPCCCHCVVGTWRGTRLLRWQRWWWQRVVVTEGGGDRGWWWQRVVATDGGGDRGWWWHGPVLIVKYFCKKKENMRKLIEQMRKKKTYLSPNDAVASFGLTLCSSLPCRCPGTSCSFVVMCLARSLPWWWIQKVTGCGEKVGPVLSSPVWTHKYDQTNIQNTFSS